MDANYLDNATVNKIKKWLHHLTITKHNLFKNIIMTLELGVHTIASTVVITSTGTWYMYVCTKLYHPKLISNLRENYLRARNVTRSTQLMLTYVHENAHTDR